MGGKGEERGKGKGRRGGEGKGGEREEGKERGGEDPLDLLPRKNFLAIPLP